MPGELSTGLEVARAAGDADAKTVLTGDVASCYHRLGEYEAALAI
jgi:hypothetical protein